MKKALLIILILIAALSIAFGVIFFNMVLNRDVLGLKPYAGLNSSEYEWVTIENDGLVLQGYLKQNPNSDCFVILIHGYTGSGRTMLEYADYYTQNGYNILIIDHRAHGNSEGKFCTMGIKETGDVLSWIDFLITINPNAKIVLHGISMGAATTMTVSGSDNLPSNVIASIEDCGFTSIYEEFTHQIKERSGIKVRALLRVSSLYAKLRAGFFYGEDSPIEAVRESNVPILFIHGTHDGFVPFEMQKRLYDAANCEKEIVEIDGAGHVMSHHVDPEKYWSAVDSFLKKYVD